MHMYSKRRALNSVLIGTSLALASGATSAATVVFYDFDSGTTFTNAVDTKDANVSAASAWRVGTGSISNQNGVAGGRAVGANWDSTQFLEFDFDIAPGFVLTLSGVSFDERFGGTGAGGGPQKAFSSGWNLLVNGVERTSGPTGLDTDTGTGTGNADDFKAAILDQALSLGGLTGKVTIRLTGDLPAPALVGFPGSWRVDNFRLEGTLAPVPLPAAAWFMGSAVVGLAFRRRVGT